MKFAIMLVLLIGVVSLIGTILVARTVETNYGKSIKRNIGNLTIIYVILILGLLIGLVWYAFVAL
ncbi:putative membrane protein [Anoxybacillus sp. B7M1]|jgi:cytochrome c biogenesis protein ResB|uniref:Uncharacterized protein n=1 Tax=Anoxybacteroides rupiense TaxID=311460 RepID=A0ABT5W6K8_9BACL|nr:MULTISPECIES: hypothetical protein [Anoxybacillus]ANB57073.1 putative membrane protein [Anoxybacillus sp. B2M1]ANB62551.1 putative membrane protein [Anoxybacillus sp. B7M1]KXG09179.1 hypothetical protein AT864_02644 [Anoxybacillus sp. P3H1B]MBB3908703.1 cytochrome c biogenesis protein ResB [Anoxybacillus rupiensis]MBS2770342.1 hypothetical protein [Anoxybacillus rupiensis]